MKRIPNKKVRNGLIIILLIINVSALSSFIVAKFTSGKNAAQVDPNCEVERILVQQIGFDEEQMKDYMKLRENYDRDIDNIRMIMHQNMTEMLAEIGKKNPDTAVIYSHAEIFGRYEAEIKVRTMKHLLQLRQLSKSGQEERFAELFGQLQYRHRRGWGRGQGMGMGRGRGMGYGRQNNPYWQNQAPQDTVSKSEWKTF